MNRLVPEPLRGTGGKPACNSLASLLVRELLALGARRDLQRRPEPCPRATLGRQPRLSTTLRRRPAQTPSGRAQHQEQETNGRLEQRLLDRSPDKPSDLMCDGRVGQINANPINDA